MKSFLTVPTLNAELALAVELLLVASGGGVAGASRVALELREWCVNFLIQAMMETGAARSEFSRTLLTDGEFLRAHC